MVGFIAGSTPRDANSSGSAERRTGATRLEQSDESHCSPNASNRRAISTATIITVAPTGQVYGLFGWHGAQQAV